MAFEIFDFPFCTPQDEYPGGSTIKFGRGYRFAAKPNGPDEVISHLNFENMFVFQKNAGDAPDITVNPQLNVYALEAFYKRHLMYQPFQWKHPILGFKICRFNKALVMPKTIKSSPGMVGGMMVAGQPWRIHQVEAFTIDLLLQP